MGLGHKFCLSHEHQLHSLPQDTWWTWQRLVRLNDLKDLFKPKHFYDSIHKSPRKVLTAPLVHKGFEIPTYCGLSVLISADGPYNTGDL